MRCRSLAAGSTCLRIRCRATSTRRAPIRRALDHRADGSVTRPRTRGHPAHADRTKRPPVVAAYADQHRAWLTGEAVPSAWPHSFSPGPDASSAEPRLITGRRSPGGTKVTRRDGGDREDARRSPGDGGQVTRRARRVSRPGSRIRGQAAVTRARDRWESTSPPVPGGLVKKSLKRRTRGIDITPRPRGQAADKRETSPRRPPGASSWMLREPRQQDGARRPTGFLQRKR